MPRSGCNRYGARPSGMVPQGPSGHHCVAYSAKKQEIGPMSRQRRDRRVLIGKLVAESSTVGIVCRLTGHHRSAVLRVPSEMGEHCAKLMDSPFRDRLCTNVWASAGSRFRDGEVGFTRLIRPMGLIQCPARSTGSCRGSGSRSPSAGSSRGGEESLQAP